MKILWEKWNDQLSILVLGGIIGMWVAQGTGCINLPESVIGATILAFGLVTQFYFRKDKPVG